MSVEIRFTSKETQVHNLKTLPKFYEDIMHGNKTFEVVENDREFKVNDILILEEWDSARNYTGRKLARRIIYILDEEECCKKGKIILGMR